MKFAQNIRTRWRELFRKRRFTMLNATDRTEEWHMHLSPASIIAAFASFALILFIIILTLVAYTPVLEFLPGYRTEAYKSREGLIHDIMRLDSMERMMNDMMTYNENIALIMEGKTPVVRTVSASDSLRATKVLVMPSPEDSLLRVQMEGEGAYALNGQERTSRRSVREAMEMVKPVEGIVTERFGIKEGRYGVRIAGKARDRVTAINNGTVIMSLWTPETGHIIQIQHPNNLLSVYRNLSQSLVTTGQTVRPGDLIGYNADTENGEVKLFEFEIWSNGKPVDPESYIVF